MRDDVELVRPQSPDADPAAAAAQLNEERQRLLDEAMALAAERRLVESARHEYALQKKYTSVMIRVCHSRLRFLSCMYIHDKFMTESR